MRWQTVIKKLNDNYERAKKASFVQKPMAYALHKTWLEVDRYERKKNYEKRKKASKERGADE